MPKSYKCMNLYVINVFFYGNNYSKIYMKIYIL